MANFQRHAFPIFFLLSRLFTNSYHRLWFFLTFISLVFARIVHSLRWLVFGLPFCWCFSIGTHTLTMSMSVIKFVKWKWHPPLTEKNTADTQHTLLFLLRHTTIVRHNKYLFGNNEQLNCTSNCSNLNKPRSTSKWRIEMNPDLHGLKRKQVPLFTFIMTEFVYILIYRIIKSSTIWRLHMQIKYISNNNDDDDDDDNNWNMPTTKLYWQLEECIYIAMRNGNINNNCCVWRWGA